jgi:predicted PurR-regulated permease PerM
MNKEQFRKGLYYALIIFAGLAFAITYFFLLYSGQDIGAAIGSVFTMIRPVIMGAVIAYIMKSTCNFYEKHILRGMLQSPKKDEQKAKKSANIIAVVLTYITWAIIFTALLWVAIPQIVDSVTNFINVFQPEVFSIGGGISNEKDYLLEPLKKIVEVEQYSRNSDKKTQIKIAELGNRAGIIGAASLGR